MTRTVDLNDHRVTIKANLQIHGGKITPTQYEGFRAWARETDRLERVILNAENPTSAIPTRAKVSARGDLKQTGQLPAERHP